jgi:hypothetical protein
MQFTTEDDFKGVLAPGVLLSLQGTGDENLIEAEQLAISHLSPLRDKYDIDGELAKTTTSRNRELLRMVVNITAYYLYNTVPDDDIPQRIIDNFNMELKNIDAIVKGRYCTLNTLEDSAGETKTNFRSGSDDLRSHDPFY